MVTKKNRPYFDVDSFFFSVKKIKTKIGPLYVAEGGQRIYVQKSM